MTPDSLAAARDDAFEAYLAPTAFVDCNHPDVARFAEQAVDGITQPVEKARRLYYAVRDGIRYDPYSIDDEPGHYRASHVLKVGRGFCVAKAVLLTAAARSADLPTRLGFADVRNHLATQKLLEMTGTDLFVYHGYVEFHLHGRWVKATPAFNLSLCEKFRVKPLEFDGKHDSLFHPYDAEGKRHMEYVVDHGAFADLPFERMMAVFHDTYPKLFADREAHGPDEFEKEAEAENAPH